MQQDTLEWILTTYSALGMKKKKDLIYILAVLSVNCLLERKKKPRY